MARVTWQEIDEETLKLADLPNRQRPNFEIRMAAYMRAARYYARKAQHTPKPQLVSSFPLDVQSGQSEYNIPRDDFGGIDVCTSDPQKFPGEGTRMIDVINADDAALYAGTSVPLSGGRVVKIAERQDFDSTSGYSTYTLVTYPPDARDSLLVFYRVLPNRAANALDACPLTEAAALALIPAHAIYHSLGKSFAWLSYEPGEDVMSRRSMVIDAAEKLLQTETELYEMEIYYHDKAHPSQNLQGMNARRRVRRQSGRRRSV